MDLGIDGNAVAVTAGSAGLGLASAEVMAEEGANVAVCGRTEARLAEARETLASAGEGDVLAVQADITERGHVESFLDETIDAFGGLDHLVVSAGGPPSGSFLDTDDEDWYDAYDLLVMSAVRATRHAHPHLVESDAGTVVNVTSRSVAEVVDSLVLSNAVRRAVIGLMKTQSREWAPDVRVNAVLPGSHETDRIMDLVEQGVEAGRFDSYEQGLEAWASGTPLERVGDPRELGEAVAYLSSERSSYITGTALPVDGGSMRSV